MSILLLSSSYSYSSHFPVYPEHMFASNLCTVWLRLFRFVTCICTLKLAQRYKSKDKIKNHHWCWINVSVSYVHVEFSWIISCTISCFCFYIIANCDIFNFNTNKMLSCNVYLIITSITLQQVCCWVMLYIKTYRHCLVCLERQSVSFY